MDTKEFMEVHVWPRLSPELIFKNLSGLRETNTGISADCPRCGAKGRFYAKNDKRYGACNRRNECAHVVGWWKYVQVSHGFDKKETFLYLCDLAGVEPPEQANRRIFQPKDQYELRETIVRFGRNNLMSNWPPAVRMRGYLLGRGFTLEELKESELMYIEKDHLMKYLYSKALSYKIIKHSGIATKQFGEQYNLIIPFRGMSGKIEGFVGRLNNGLQPMDGVRPKYKNSFDLRKSVPFNFHDADREDVKTMKVVESPLCALLIRAKKIKGLGVVAFMGDSPTWEAAEEIINSKPPVILMALDDDAAGKKAAMRFLSRMDNPEKRAFVIRSFRGHKDPGELIAAEGLDAYLDVMKNDALAPSYWALLQTLPKLKGLGSYGKVMELGEIAPIFNNATDEEKDLFIRTAENEALMHPDDIGAAVNM